MNPHDFWQSFSPASQEAPDGIFSEAYPARLTDGRQLLLPIRPLTDGTSALASLIINQASFAVVDALATDLANQLRPYDPEILIGLPTLGLTLAARVAEKLDHSRYVPLGTSRKFWYDDALSIPLASITSPEHQKRLFVDPRMLPLMKDKRVVLIDDVISSGRSIIAGLLLLQKCGIHPIAVAAAMLQTDRYKEKIAAHDRDLADRVHACFSTPLLKRTEDGHWRAE